MTSLSSLSIQELAGGICLRAEGVPLLHHPAQPWGDPAALADGCGQLVSAETLPPDHCDARIDLGDVGLSEGRAAA